MALITSFTLIRVLAVLHITMGFYFMTAPRQIADQNMIILLGESMKLVSRMPHFNIEAVLQVLT